VLLKLFRVTVTFVAVPIRPLTFIVAGYGLLVPTVVASFTVIDAGFEKTTANAGEARATIRASETSCAIKVREVDRSRIIKFFLIYSLLKYA